MNNTLNIKEQIFADFFNDLEDWSEKFNYLLGLGEALPPMPEHLKTIHALIHGCTSKTYFVAQFENRRLKIYGWSNAGIPAGLIEMLRIVFEDATPEELAATEINIHKLTELHLNMTPTRVASFLKMIERIQNTIL